METGRVQQGGAAGELGADLVGQAGAGERSHIDRGVGLGEELDRLRPGRW